MASFTEYWNRIFRRHGMSDISQLFVQNYGGTAIWPDEKNDTYTDSYTGNGDVFTIINRISEPSARVPIIHVIGEDEVVNSKTLALLDEPSPSMGMSEFIEAALGYYMIYGNMYLNALKPEGGLNAGKPVRLEFLPPPFTSIMAGTRLDPVVGYVLNYLGSTLNFEVQDVLHWKEFNPDWDDNFGVYGMSRLKAVLKSVAASDSAYQSMVSAFQNQGAYGLLTVLGVKNDQGGYDGRSVTKKQMSALKNQFKPGGEYVGDTARGKIAATNKSVEWTNLGLSPVDLKILDSLGVNKGSIADAYGYPGVLLSGSDDKTYSNYAEAEKSAWSNARQPFLDGLLQKLSRWLIPMMGEQGRLVADYSGIDVLQKNKREMVDWMRLAGYSLDEIRVATGGEATGLPGMTVPLVSMGSVPVDQIGFMPNMEDTEKYLKDKIDYRVN